MDLFRKYFEYSICHTGFAVYQIPALRERMLMAISQTIHLQKLLLPPG